MTKPLRFLISLLMLMAGLAILFTSRAAAAESITGDWTGKLELPSGALLQLTIHISSGADGKLEGTMDSPDQGAFGIPASSVGWQDGQLNFAVASIGGTYQARMVADDRLEGKWTQGGTTLALSMIRGAGKAAPKRTQEPQGMDKYRAEVLTFANPAAGITLAGTLTLPNGKGPFPAAILISGSGPQDRDESIMGHRPFLIIADYLSSHGYAVLRYDDRGFGKSGGSFQSATSRDFATDATAAWQYLKQRPEIDAQRVGLIGHSEGGYIAAMAAGQNPHIAFVISLAGTGIPGAQILDLQSELISAAMGISPEIRRMNRQLSQKLHAIVMQEADDAVAKKRLRETLQAFIKELPDTQRQAFQQQMASNEAMEMNVSQLTSPWFRFFLSYDPALDWRKVTCPVLALNGGKDLQVPASENLTAIQKALATGGNTRVTAEELAGLNHLFQMAQTGSPGEYATIEETVNPLLLMRLSTWLDKTITP